MRHADSHPGRHMSIDLLQPWRMSRKPGTTPRTLHTSRSTQATTKSTHNCNTGNFPNKKILKALTNTPVAEQGEPPPEQEVDLQCRQNVLQDNQLAVESSEDMDCSGKIRIHRYACLPRVQKRATPEAR